MLCFYKYNNEYIEIFHRMIDKKGKNPPKDDSLTYFINSLSIIEDSSSVHRELSTIMCND